MTTLCNKAHDLILFPQLFNVYFGFPTVISLRWSLSRMTAVNFFSPLFSPTLLEGREEKKKEELVNYK